MAHTYCIDEKLWTEAVSPVQPPTYIGPQGNCKPAAPYYPFPVQPYWGAK